MNFANIHEQFQIGITKGELITELTFNGFLHRARTAKHYDVARQKELQSIFLQIPRSTGRKLGYLTGFRLIFKP